MSVGGRFRDQSYEKLVKHHRELGVPWTDPAFPPSDASVGAAKVRQLGRKVEWKRPAVSVMWWCHVRHTQCVSYETIRHCIV